MKGDSSVDNLGDRLARVRTGDGHGGPQDSKEARKPARCARTWQRSGLVHRTDSTQFQRRNARGMFEEKQKV